MEKINNQKMSIWRLFNNTGKTRTFEQIYNGIKGGSIKEFIYKIRSATNEIEKDKLKSQLYAFTASGTFKESRSIDDLVSYTGLIVLDIDHLQSHQVNEVANKAKAIDYSIMVFVSPSGLGVKIIVALDSTLEQHEVAYNQVLNYYQIQLGVEFDHKTKDITRLCYMSYDENAYYEPNAKIFNVNSVEPQTEVLTETLVEENFDKKMGYIEHKVSMQGSFIMGNRNNYIHNLACLGNRLGMNKEVLTSYTLQKFTKHDLQSSEIISTIESAYKRTDQFNTYNYPSFVSGNKSAHFDNNSDANVMPDEEKELSLDSPYISDFVKDNLPNFMQVILSRLNPREQDVFIIGTLTALSGCIEAAGAYGNKRYYSSCYSFISAPPASGKGALNYCNQLVLPLHKAIKKHSEEAQKKYEAESLEFEQRKRDGDRSAEKPEKPLFKTIMIPADSSYSQLVEHLQNNGEQGLIIETEADTMVKMFNSDFGNYSDILRKAFEHEPISQRRKTDKQYIDMYNPRLAVCLSGTPNQLSKLVSSVEDGLFSRFIYYVFSNTPKWYDVTPSASNEVPLPDLIAEIGQELATKLTEQRKKPVDFKLSDNQWKKINEVFSERVQQISCFVGKEFSSNIFRLGVSVFRIAMTLSVLRIIENDTYDESINCNDTDFEIAMSLSETFYQHLIFAFKVVKNSNEVLNKQLQRLFDILPVVFDRKTAIEQAKKSGINCHERTVDKYLKRLVEYEYLEKNEYNNYRKNNQSKNAA